MENTIANLHYVLKDHDIKGEPVIQQMIQNVIIALQKVLSIKRTRWVQEEKQMEECPCKGCE